MKASTSSTLLHKGVTMVFVAKKFDVIWKWRRVLTDCLVKFPFSWAMAEYKVNYRQHGLTG